MSGKNKILKPGEQLFRLGESSDGMYVIRRGQILVYIEKGDSEIKLATLGAGSMLGEMALFDKKPRSASARAIDEVEVTKISNDEFHKILTQIPKWFVSLMSTLSSRLRDTNERLQKFEASKTPSSSSNPIDELIRIMQVLQLLFYKHGVKELKSWMMERDIAETQIAMVLGIEPTLVAATIDAIVQCGLLSLSKNSYKKDLLNSPNRGDIERFGEFVAKLRKKDLAMRYLPQAVVDMLELIVKQAQGSVYDTCAITLSDLEAEGKKKGFVVASWAKSVSLLINIDDCLTVAKNGSDIQFKIQKKPIELLLIQAKILRSITRSEENRQDNKVA